MERQIKGVIFDLDGTIVDSMPMWRSLDRDFISSLGLKYDPELSNEIVGMTLEQAAEHFHDRLEIKLSVPEIISQWRDYLFEQYKHNIPLKPGISELIDKWHKEGVKMCVATLTEKQMATMILKKYGLMEKLEFVLTVYEVGKSKLNPDIYLQSAKKMGVPVNECVVIEDTFHAMKTAKNAGFTVYAIHEETAVFCEEIHGICDRYLMDFKVLL